MRMAKQKSVLFFKDCRKRPAIYIFQHFRKCWKRNSDGKLFSSFFFFKRYHEPTWKYWNSNNRVPNYKGCALKTKIFIVTNKILILISFISRLDILFLFSRTKNISNKTSSSALILCRLVKGLEMEEIFKLIRLKLANGGGSFTDDGSLAAKCHLITSTPSERWRTARITERRVYRRWQLFTGYFQCRLVIALIPPPIPEIINYPLIHLISWFLQFKSQF